MKTIKVIALAASFILLSPNTHAAKNRCQNLKKSAIKAKKLYQVNKKQAIVLSKHLTVLKKDQRKIPKNVKAAKRLLSSEVHKLSESKKQRLATSLKYLEKHIQLVEAVKKKCVRKPVKKRHRAKVLMTVAGQ